MRWALSSECDWLVGQAVSLPVNREFDEYVDRCFRRARLPPSRIPAAYSRLGRSLALLDGPASRFNSSRNLRFMTLKIA